MIDAEIEVTLAGGRLWAEPATAEWLVAELRKRRAIMSTWPADWLHDMGLVADGCTDWTQYRDPENVMILKGMIAEREAEPKSATDTSCAIDPIVHLPFEVPGPTGEQPGPGVPEWLWFVLLCFIALASLIIFKP